MTSSLSDERRLLERLADMVAEFRAEKRRLEFERKLYAVCRIRTQNGICLN